MVPPSRSAWRAWLRCCLMSASDTVPYCCIPCAARIALRAQSTRPPSPWLRSGARGPGTSRRRYARCRSRRRPWRRLRCPSMSLLFDDVSESPDSASSDDRREAPAQRPSTGKLQRVGSLEPGPRVGRSQHARRPPLREDGPEGKVRVSYGAQARQGGFPPTVDARAARAARAGAH